MSLLLLQGLILAEMAEKNLVWVMGRGWIPKDQADVPMQSTVYELPKRVKRKYKK